MPIGFLAKILSFMNQLFAVLMIFTCSVVIKCCECYNFLLKFYPCNIFTL